MMKQSYDFEGMSVDEIAAEMEFKAHMEGLVDDGYEWQVSDTLTVIRHIHWKEDHWWIGTLTLVYKATFIDKQSKYHFDSLTMPFIGFDQLFRFVSDPDEAVEEIRAMHGAKFLFEN